jgi:hypothetical protein
MLIRRFIDPDAVLYRVIDRARVMAMHYKDDGGIATAHYAVLERGMPLEEAILRSAWRRRGRSGTRSCGICRWRRRWMWPCCGWRSGVFGSMDTYGPRKKGTRKLERELTVRDGRVVWDLNGITREDWEGMGKYLAQGDARWDGTLGGEVRRRKQGELSSPWLVVGIWWLCEKGY